MNNTALPRLAAACGAVFAIGLAAANGSGSSGFSEPRAVLGIAALTLALPFLACVSGMLRDPDEPGGWLASTALAAGIAGIVIKIASGAPELALHTAHVAAGTQLGTSFEALGNGATILSLYPFAVFCAAAAVAGWRTRVLPRWLAGGAAIAAAALAVNGAFLTSDVVPGFLLFLVWTLLASVVLVRRPRRQAAASRRSQVAESTAG